MTCTGSTQRKEIFEVKRNGMRDDVLTSNVQLKNISTTGGSQT